MEILTDEIVVLGESLKINLRADTVCSHSPDYDEFFDRVRKNTKTINTNGITWELAAIENFDSAEVTIRSRNNPFNGQNLGLTVPIKMTAVEHIDKVITEGFGNYPDAQTLLIEYLKNINS